MSPENIVQKAVEKKLDMIAITDHNCTKQAPLIQQLAAKKGLVVICGAEVNTAEEVHCLTLFKTQEQLLQFQLFIDQHLPPVPNSPEHFGEQIVVDQNEMIVEEVPYLLINALDVTLAEVQQKTHQLGGLVIPAHIDRPYNGLFSQLGFIPENFNPDAFELSKNAEMDTWIKHSLLPNGVTLIGNSDAHHPNQIGESCTLYELEKPTFDELRMALLKRNGRRVIQIEKNKN